MNNTSKIVIGAIVLIVIVGSLLILDKPQTTEEIEFLVNAETIPATPVSLKVGDNIDVDITVRDNIDEPDEEPWTLCGIVAGAPAASSDEIFPFDYLGNLVPTYADVEIIQDEENDSINFPQGGGTGTYKGFTCDAGGTDEIYFYYMTSRLVDDCNPETLLIMQNDPNAAKKSISLGQVECVDPTAPPKKKGVIHSPGPGDGIEEGQEVEIPEGFEYVGPQTIEVGPDGEFIDHGYLDRGNPPE